MKKLQEKETDPNPKPTRSPTAYFIFLKDFRKQMNGKVEGNKIPALAGEKWRGMSEEDKAPYKTKEAAAKEEHEKAMVEYRKKVSFLLLCCNTNICVIPVRLTFC